MWMWYSRRCDCNGDGLSTDVRQIFSVFCVFFVFCGFKISSTEDTERHGYFSVCSVDKHVPRKDTDEEEDEGEGTYTAEDFCPQGDVADFADDLYFTDDGNGVDASAIDGVAKELVLILVLGAFKIDGV